MTDSNNRQAVRSEVIRSPALLMGEIRVTEHEDSRGRRLFSGTRLKALVFPFLLWTLKHSSVAVALVPLRVLLWMMRALYGWSNNPLRLSCEYVCRLAHQSGYQHDPRQVYRQFLANILSVVRNYFELYRFGIHRVQEHIRLSQPDAEMMRGLAQKHGGVILAVPHNLASAFSSLRLNKAFSLLVVARNSPTIARTKIALEFFERMEVSILMVRGGNAFELSRTLFSVLRSGKTVAATLDNIDKSNQRMVVQMFGQEVGLSAWAAKIAVRLEVPVVPCYFRTEEQRNTVVFGEPIITTDVRAAVQHYASFFEREILEDPASWAYLADKHWRETLRGASGL